MAGFEFNIDTGQIDADDTKSITVIGRDNSGSKVTLSSIDFEIEEGGGTTTTYSKSDFNESSKEYQLDHQFSESGIADFDIKATDKGGHTERETDSEYIHP